MPHYIITIFSMMLLIPTAECSINKTQNTKWDFSKVSDADIFGNHDSDTIKFLHEIYNKVTISIDGEKLTISDRSLDNEQICSIDYVEVKKTPLSYYLSNTTVDMYRKLFKHEKITFHKEFFILSSLSPDHECPVPYSEIIKIDDQLMITDKDYSLFFKDVKLLSETGSKTTKKESRATYCYNENPNKIYDGSSKEYCQFKGFNLEKAYAKFLEISNYDSTFLKGKIPTEDLSYKTHDKAVNYKWIEWKLSISVMMENEQIDYFFKDDSSGVDVEIIHNTQY